MDTANTAQDVTVIASQPGCPEFTGTYRGLCRELPGFVLVEHARGIARVHASRVTVVR